MSNNGASLSRWNDSGMWLIGREHESPSFAWVLCSARQSLSSRIPAFLTSNRIQPKTGLFSLMPFANSEGITSRTKQMVWPQEGAQAATRANRRSCAGLLSLLSQAFVPEYKSDQSLRLPLAIDGSERNKYRKVSEPVMNSVG